MDDMMKIGDGLDQKRSVEIGYAIFKFPQPYSEFVSHGSRGDYFVVP